MRQVTMGRFSMARGSVVAALIVLGISVAALLVMIAHWSEVAGWARDQQRVLQTALARGVQAARAGEATAVFGLIGVSALYGLAHAVGPGHGKLLIGGAAIASRRTVWRMAGIGLAASLMQAATAILLIYGGFALFSISGDWAVGATERVLAPLSFAAIALVGVWIAFRGLRLLLRGSAARAGGHAHDGHHPRHHHHHHDHDDHANCRHGPTADEVERIEGWRDALALIASIGVRPCSGALIVLAISWRFGLYGVGAASAVAMAVGTGIVVSGVALAAGFTRDAAALRAPGDGVATLFALVQLLAGLAVAALSGALLFGAVL